MNAMQVPYERTSPREGPLVELRGAGVAFGRHPVLRDIDLSIARGQTLAVIGESGCGKTVLLKTMIGLVTPTRGEVRFDGKILAKLSEQQLTRERTRFGFVFQGAALFDSMTVGQNVGFPLREHTKKGQHEIDEIVVSRLAEVGLPESIIAKKPAELSGGMRKRVGLARALALNPELMLYDEPTTGLDPIMSDVINELMLRTRQQHPVTSVIVTHDMRTAAQSGRPRDHALPAFAVGGRRAADRVRRAARSNRSGQRPARHAVRARRGGRTADGAEANGGSQRQQRLLTRRRPRRHANR